MKKTIFGLAEAKEFCESHEDERVRILWKWLCEAKSKNAKWCEALNAAHAAIAELQNQLTKGNQNERN